MLPRRAPARSSRLAGAAGALLLQGGFLLLFLASMPVFRPPAAVERELRLILPRRFAPLPLPSAESQGLPGPVRVTPPLLLPPGPAIIAPAFPPTALPGLQTFGQALNNCAPEKFNSLTAEERARCPRPGAGVAELPSLLPTPSHAKDAATWQEQWDETHWMPGLCGPDQGSSVVGCLIQQSIAEHEREEDAWYHINKAKAEALKEPKHALPENIGAWPHALPPENPHPPG